MTNTYAIIENNVVVNKVLADADFAAEQGWVTLPEGVDIGWTYDGETATPPEPVVIEPTSAPTKEELLAQLQALSDQINALG